MSYLIFYTESCSPKLKKFSTKKEAVKFDEEHEKKNLAKYSDDWVDVIIKGDIVKTYQSWYGEE